MATLWALRGDLLKPPKGARLPAWPPTIGPSHCSPIILRANANRGDVINSGGTTDCSATLDRVARFRRVDVTQQTTAGFVPVELIVARTRDAASWTH